MSETRWDVVDEAAGTFQAEILRGLLEAQGIPVVLSQEGAGHWAYTATVGRLGRVQILVPVDSLADARKVLEDYRAGVFEVEDEENEAGETSDNSDNPDSA